MRERNQKARKKWKLLIEYGVFCKEFSQVDAEAMTDTILYAYQEMRLWRKMIPRYENTVQNFFEKIRHDLERQDAYDV